MAQQAQSAPDLIEKRDIARTMGGTQKVAPRPSQSAAYASADHLISLGAYLEGLSKLTRETGWHTPATIVSFGDTDGEAIVVGVRWVGDTYYVEIR